MAILQILKFISILSAATRFAWLGLCFSPGFLIAASLTWGPSGTGGSGTWEANGAVNWFNGTSAVKWPAPVSTDDDAVFSGTSGIISLASGGITANDITFNVSGFTLQDQTLMLNGTTPTLTTAAGVSAEISSTLTGSAGFIKTGAGSTGVLTLSGNNSISGSVAINSGFLRLTHSNALGTTAKTLSLNGSIGIAAGLGLSLDPGAGGSVVLPGNIAISMASNSYAGIRNKSGNNEIKGAISLKTGLASSTIASEAGTLTISGAVTSVASGRMLYLTGNSTAENSVSGVISNGSGLSLTKSDAGSWKLSATNTYTGTTTITAGKLTGVTGGSCANSAVSLVATTGNKAVLGVSITDNTKRWTCASLAINNAGTASDLEFNFGTITPSTTLAPLNITGAADFITTPNINVIADSNLGPIGTKFPLITWGSTTGTLPSTFTLTTSNPTTAHLELTGNALYLVIDDYTPTLSDTQLFSALNLDYPGLDTVKAQVVAGNFPAAKTALATYLRTRSNVNWFFDWRNPTNTIGYDQAAADLTVAGTFSLLGVTYTYPNETIDWNYNLNPTSQWASLMNRMPFWPNLGASYWGTSNEVYAQAWLKQFRSWITQNPVPSTTQSILAPWATIQAADRMKTSWPDSFFRYVLSPSIPNEDLVVYLKSSIEHGRYLRQWSTTTALNMNIHAWELSGLYTTATVFPELNEAAEWRSYAAQDMYAQESLQFYPDGVQIELSPRYHIGTLDHLLDIYDLAKMNNRQFELPAGYLANLEKAFDFILGNSAPNRLMPPFNDCGSANESSLDWLSRGYGYFPNRTDFLWTSGGGTKPVKTSWNFPYAGYAAMRSGWETNANFLCFDVGPLGSSSHRHEDKLNVVLWAYGRELLFDSGGGSYESSVWRTWGTSSYSHNCITVDDLDQEGGDGSYAATDADYQSQAPINIRWESGALHDFAAGTYNRGYGGNYNNRPAAQTRRVLFVKPDIYLVADTMVPSNTVSHTYQARWNLLTPNTSFDPVTKTVVTTDAGKANLAVVPCLGSGLTVANISARLSNSGSTTPVLSEMLGWDQPDLSTTRTPATTVTQTLSGTGTKQFLTLFLPLKSGQANPVTSIVNTGATAAEVTLTDGRKLQVYADPDPTRGLKLTEILPGNIPARYVGAGYTPPVIAGLVNQNVGPSAIINQPFTVTDNSPIANVTVTVRSLNQALVPDANLTLGGSGNNRTLTANLTPNKTGAATLIVTALDPDGSITSEAIEITAAYPPDSPPVALAANIATLPNIPLDIDLGTLVSDAETPDSSLLFKVSNPVNGSVTLLPDGRTARFTPANNFTGAANFQYSATDLGNDPRIYAHYGMDAPDDVATALIQDTSLNNHPADISTVGTGSAQLVTDAPSALAAFDTQSIQLTESGDNNGARLQRTISSTDLNLNDQSWTFACWFKRTTTTNDDFIFHLGSGNGYGSDEELQLWCQSGNSKVGLAHWNGTAADLNITSGAVAPAGQWLHIALTYARVSVNRGNLAFFINGIPAGSASNIPFNFNQANPVNIGGHAQSTSVVSRWFNGRIDEAVIVKAALTSQEISLLATQPVARLGGTTVTNIVSVTVGNPLTAIQQWRQTYFGTTANTGNAADSTDSNDDGETNLLEFATGQNPNAATRAQTAVTKAASNLDFTYTRSLAAMGDGVIFTVEWSDTLAAGSWTHAGVSEEILSDNGIIQTVRASVAAGAGGRRFLHLNVAK